MGKRSDFKRLKGDTYYTIDKRAVQILAPYAELDHPDKLFVEPCCGEMHLVNDLCDHGWTCTGLGDIDQGRDFFDWNAQDVRDSVIITNPPWTRTILHDMIEHAANIANASWFLFDADWMHTKQAKGLLQKYITDIVSVGRLKWIPDSTMSGKDNCAWHRISLDKPRLHTRFWPSGEING